MCARLCEHTCVCKSQYVGARPHMCGVRAFYALHLNVFFFLSLSAVGKRQADAKTFKGPSRLFSLQLNALRPIRETYIILLLLYGSLLEEIGWKSVTAEGDCCESLLFSKDSSQKCPNVAPR